MQSMLVQQPDWLHSPHTSPAVQPPVFSYCAPSFCLTTPSKFTPAHDAFAAAMSQRHHPIIYVGEGPIHLTNGFETRSSQNPIFAHLLVGSLWGLKKDRVLCCVFSIWICVHVRGYTRANPRFMINHGEGICKDGISRKLGRSEALHTCSLYMSIKFIYLCICWAI